MDPEGRPHYYPAIDGLRAVAVLAIIAFHLAPGIVPGGFLGVDVFFVVSGYVVASAAARRPESSLSRFSMGFFARRVRRILPALVVCIVVTELVAVCFLPTIWLVAGPERVGWHGLLGVANRELVNSDGYFSLASDFNPFTHLWSLGVEEQFYLLFPLAFFGWRIGGTWRKVSVAVVGAAFAVTLRHARTLTLTGHATLAFYSLSTRLWQIAAGVLLFQLGLRISSRWSALGGYLGLAVMLGAFLFGLETDAVWPLGFVVVAATVATLACLVRTDVPVLRSRVMNAIGRRSYSLYLWHWPVVVFLRWSVGLESPAEYIAAIVLSAALAELSYRFVESAVRRSDAVRRQPPWLVVVTGLAVVAGSVFVVRSAIDHKSQLSRSTVIRNASDWVAYDMPLTRPMPTCEVVSRPDQAHGLAITVFTRIRCGPPISPSTMFIAGDSHAGAYAGLIKQFVLSTGVPVQLVSEPGCSFLLELPVVRDNGACRKVTASTLTWLAERTRSGDVLFLPSSRVYPLTVAAPAAAPPDPHDALVALSPLAGRGVRVVWAAPTPVFRAEPFRCADWFDKSNPACSSGTTISRSELERYRSDVMRAMQTIDDAIGSQTWDPVPTLCSATICSAFRDGRPLSFDGHHLTAYANRLLVPSFTAAMTNPLLPSTASPGRAEQRPQA